MDFHFDAVVNRRGTDSVKWDEPFNQRLYPGTQDILPLWLADMDFKTAPCIQQALVERAQQGIFGYHTLVERARGAVQQWLLRRHGWKVDEQAILFLPSVVSAFNIASMALLKMGSRILIQPPVYGPFYLDARHGFEIVENALVQDNRGHYTMDYDRLEEQAKDADALLLCNPHNPVGRCWSREELTRMLDILKKHDVLLLSDEIHADLVMPGYVHTAAGTLPGAAERTMVFGSASKAFNVPGLATCYAVVEDAALRKRFTDVLDLLHIEHNLFGLQALIAAYDQGDVWLDALRQYIQDNMEYAAALINGKVPGVQTTVPEATYLMWLNATQHPDTNPVSFFASKGVGLGKGSNFGKAYARYLRLTAATPRPILQEALSRMVR